MDKYLVMNETNEDGERKVYKFENGYGASVIRTKYSYGYNLGLWEIACIIFVNDEDYEISYNNNVTDDVIGHLNWEDVEVILERINNLKG